MATGRSRAKEKWPKSGEFQELPPVGRVVISLVGKPAMATTNAAAWPRQSQTDLVQLIS